jgi:hypothetical protein
LFRFSFLEAKMRKSFLFAAVAAAMSLGVASGHAQVLMYSFEAGDSPNQKDGFLPNGPGFTLSSSTIGATNGSSSLKMVSANTGFEIGALTTADVPAVLTNPALAAVTLDLTISPNDPAFTGGFADLGFVLFVSNAGEGEFGDQYGPPTSDYVNINLAPGTYTGLSIPLVGNDPDTGNPISFGGLLGEGWAVSGFEITDSENGVQTFYVDNIEGVVPEPASIGIGAVSGLMLLARRRRKA